MLEYLVKGVVSKVERDSPVNCKGFTLAHVGHLEYDLVDCLEGKKHFFD